MNDDEQGEFYGDTDPNALPDGSDGSLGLSAGTYLLGQYINHAEIPRIQNEISALQSRLDQLTPDPRPGPGLRLQRLP